MKLACHHCRFVEWKPSSICCLCFNNDSSLLAVGRENGNIELWDTEREPWTTQRIIVGSVNSQLRSVVWAGERLFSAGLNGNVVEWDTITLSPKNVLESSGGPVWSMALSHSGDRLAVACEDGAVRILDISGGGLEVLKQFQRHKGRVLAVDWSADDAFVVTGASDSAIRKYRVASGSAEFRIRVGKTGAKATMVWAVRMLRDGTIVSGHSDGHTQFWDGELGTMIKSFHSHAADVLALAVGPSHTDVFATGTDNKIVLFQLREQAQAVTEGVEPETVSLVQWFSAQSRRPHSHDLRTLAISPTRNVMVSGGVDAQLVITRTDEFISRPPTKLLPYPHHPVVHVLSTRRALLCQHNSHIDLWALGKGSDIDLGLLKDTDTIPSAAPNHLLLRINPKGGETLRCVAGSPAGEWLAFSDAFATRLHHITYSEDGAVSGLAKVSLDGVKGPCVAMAFAGDGRLLLADHSSTLHVVQLDGTDKTATHVKAFPARVRSDTVVASVTRVCGSADGQWAASADSHNTVSLFNLDALQPHAHLPSLPGPLTALALDTAGQLLAIACAPLSILLYNVDKARALSTLNEGIKQQLSGTTGLNQHSVLSSLHFHPSAPNPMLCAASAQNMTMIRISSQGDTASSPQPKRRRTQKGTSSASPPVRTSPALSSAPTVTIDCTMRYRPLLLAGFVGDSEVAVVHRPWLQVLEGFPAPLYRKRYGSYK